MCLLRDDYLKKRLNRRQVNTESPFEMSFCTQQSVAPVIPKASIELRWQESSGNSQIDVDLAAAICSSFGELIDMACFNQTRFYNGAIVHSGDQRDGSKKGIDESLQIDFSLMPAMVDSILICVTFAKTADGSHPSMKQLSEFRLTLNGAECELDFKKQFKSSQHTFIPIVLKRTAPSSPQFALLQPLETSKHRGLEDIWPVCDRVLERIIDPVLWAERPQQSVDRLNLKKNQSIVVDHDKESGVMFFGLGWDAARVSKTVDLAAHCYALTSKGKVHDHIYYGHLQAADKSIRHTGDNLTGDGDGDDERIYVDLEKMDPNVTVLIFSVEIFTGGVTFDHVGNEYMRVVNAKHKVLARYALDDDSTFNRSNAGIFGVLRRVGRSWRFEAISKPVEKGKSHANYLLQAIERDYK